jgi:GDP-L-fucose synthase
MKLNSVLLYIVFVCWLQSGFCTEPKVLVAVKDDFVRNALVVRLQMEGYHHIREESREDIMAIPLAFNEFRPDYVIVDSSETVEMQVLSEANEAKVKKTIVLADFRIYPEKAKIPFKEDQLLDVKETDLQDPYIKAKLATLKKCHQLNGLKEPRFVFCPFPYLTGPHDKGFNIRSEHPVKCIGARVLKAKWQKASFFVVSTNKQARYEIMHIDDLASACVYLLTQPSDQEIVNISYGRDTELSTVVDYAKHYLKYPGEVIYDSTCFDTAARRVLDSSRITTLGWYPTVIAQDVIKDTVLWLETQVSTPYDPVEETPFILP